MQVVLILGNFRGHPLSPLRRVEVLEGLIEHLINDRFVRVLEHSVKFKGDVGNKIHKICSGVLTTVEE